MKRIPKHAPIIGIRRIGRSVHLSRHEIKWDTTRNESLLIRLIVDRVSAECGIGGADRLRRITMNLTACHANGCPLDFAGLFAASPLNFSHDVFGIENHIDRATGALADFFEPRYALANAVPANTLQEGR